MMHLHRIGIIAQEIEAAGMNGTVLVPDVDFDTKEDLGTQI